MTEFELTQWIFKIGRFRQWIFKINIWDPFCADANLKFEIDISISLRDMIKETDSGGMIRCIPPVSEFLKSFTFCRILCYEVTEFESTK